MTEDEFDKLRPSALAVDELRLMVIPTVLGRGRRLFPNGIDRLKLRTPGRSPGRRPGAGLPARQVEEASSMEQPTAEEALKELAPLVGEWTLEAIGPGGEPWPGEARVTIRWHDSRAHLIQRSTVEMPGAPNAVSIIGCDAANGTY